MFRHILHNVRKRKKNVIIKKNKLNNALSTPNDIYKYSLNLNPYFHYFIIEEQKMIKKNKELPSFLL